MHLFFDKSTQFSNYIPYGRKDMRKKREEFNLTQGMSLLLLKKISLPANFVFQLILFITNPENDIGYEEDILVQKKRPF